MACRTAGARDKIYTAVICVGHLTGIRKRTWNSQALLWAHRCLRFGRTDGECVMHMCYLQRLSGESLWHHSASVQGLLFLHKLQHHSIRGMAVVKQWVKFCCVLEREMAPDGWQQRLFHLQSGVRNELGLPLLLTGNICSLTSFHLHS